ncbi:uncharacterized protein LOC128549405 [Mercenaria mercenaria]|uniref:uncharacterized protein LOC128549405 n=1 Tax=Mercenaria mercenaria TaxID=6596 RepID=UPI00234F0FD5|nr:uncharacterized protein LOC128549405 [Mercenaria mercenaria]
MLKPSGSSPTSGHSRTMSTDTTSTSMPQSVSDKNLTGLSGKHQTMERPLVTNSRLRSCEDGDTAPPVGVRQTLQSNLEEIDCKLNYLANGMQNFEYQLCGTTVTLLGQKLTMLREKVPELVHPPTT